MKILRSNNSKMLEGFFDEARPLKDGGFVIDILTFSNKTLYKLVVTKGDLVYLSSVTSKQVDEPDLSYAHINLMSYVLQRGCKIRLCDPDWKESEDEMIEKEGIESLPWLISEIEGWDGGQDFYVVEPGDVRLKWVGMSLGYGNTPAESIHDYIVSPLMNEWFEQFMKEYGDE